MVAKKPKFLLVQLIRPHDHANEELENMQEVEALVATYGGTVAAKMIQHRVHPHPDAYMGPGKVEEIRELCLNQQIDVVVINGLVKPSQLFRIERKLWNDSQPIQVWDRMDLILNIFDRHAQTKVAKLQIELARLSHAGPRIYGLGGTVLSRQGGGIGQRGGGGETNIEIERRVMKKRQAEIKKELERLKRQKQERFRVRREQGFGPVALVGYTSAGKTTLFNRLTGKRKEENPQLFTTLDTVVGKMKVQNASVPILLSDTIGFIKDLPPQLVEAFRSTLLESLEAELILHVIDASDPHKDQKILTVETILHDLEIHKGVIRVYNKIDKLKGIIQEREGFWVSVKTDKGIEELKCFFGEAVY